MQSGKTNNIKSSLPVLLRQKRWVLPRHTFWSRIGMFFVRPLCRHQYGITVNRYPSDEQALILFNHQTPQDQVFVEDSFNHHIYFVATEDIFSLGFVSFLVSFTVAPIPIRKAIRDTRTVRYCLQVAKEGGSIAIAPEGNRTYSGYTGSMKESVVSLARHLKLPILLYRIEGGYGVQPRWSDERRKGTMTAGVYKRISPEECARMTDDELFNAIREGLAVNENRVCGEYLSENSAEYIERMLYTCPFCGFTKLRSSGDKFRCEACGREFEYLPTKEIKGVGFDSPYSFAGEWYDAQCKLVCGIKPEEYAGKPLFEDCVDVSEVIVYRHKDKLSDKVPMRLYGDRAELDMPEGKLILDFAEGVTSAAVLGTNKLNFYLKDGRILQFRGANGDKRFNALKYVNLYYHYGNAKKGIENDEFLGL